MLLTTVAHRLFSTGIPITEKIVRTVVVYENSLLGGLIGASGLVAVNDVISRFARRSDTVDRVMEGTETRLVEDGAYLDRQLRRLGIRTADLEAALRRQGAENVLQVKQADLYPSGAIVVDLRPEAHGASLDDIDRLERKLDQLTASVNRIAQPGS